MKLVYILLMGLILRLTFIVKPEGLWNDEYVSWMVSATPFGEGFWREVIKQCHMPLYYLYLKPFAHCSDLILRLTSVVPSVISIYIMYLVGKEYSKKTGIFAASITSVLSFLIYYAQEVRFYSLLFLFTSISLLFTIKLIKNSKFIANEKDNSPHPYPPQSGRENAAAELNEVCSSGRGLSNRMNLLDNMTKANLTGYIISSVLILFTHILGIIYVGFNTLYILYKKRTFNKKTGIGIFLVLLILLPFFAVIYKQIPSSQWWGHFTYTNILFLLSDFLSPILTNNVNAPAVFFYNIHNAYWLTVPTILGVLGICFGIKENRGLTLIALLTVTVTAFLAFTGKIVFITKYTIEVLPIFILLLSCGFVKLNKAGLVLFALFISFHLSALFTPYYVTKTFRTEGNGIVGAILNQRAPQNILFTYYAPDRFSRYMNTDAKTYHISKINRFEYLETPEKILKNIKPGETLSVVFLDSVSFFPEEYMQMYTNLPEMFVTFSHIRNKLTDTLYKEYKNWQIDRVGSWTVVTGIKR